MPVSFQILPLFNLVYTRYSVTMKVSESLVSFREYMDHPHMRPGQRHVIDLRGIVEMDPDLAAVMALEANKAENLVLQEADTMVIYLADCPLSRRAASLACNAWEAEHYVTAVILETEEAALNVLGLPHRALCEIFPNASSPTSQHG
ncbi:hypothetical protein [Marivita sp. GX14005]|uniref:hypothetical protein n=1 Tax=Marivita sp. GX14005 TaxID=2942276 RepID=UPI002019A621|nr:hypothetical protein [Marivita sp. GX14005]MCL3882863.1 hypothetical protein [Marivita sp. GX14005]